MKKKILITGGFGYLGGRLIDELLKEPESLKLIVGSRHPDNFALDGHLQDIDVVRTDLKDKELLESICYGIDVIIHLAAMDAESSIKDPIAALEVNTLGTAMLIEAAIKQNVTRFIYLSTAHVYGINPSIEITEHTLTMPVHPYALTHKAAEDLVWAADRLGRIEGIILRLSNSFGAPARMDVNCWHLLIPDLCRQAIVQKKIILKSSGLQIRNFIPITDACRAIRHFISIRLSDLEERTYNLGSLDSLSVFDMALKIQERYQILTGIKIPIDRPLGSEDEKYTQCKYNIDLLQSTGFQLKTTTNSEIDALLKFCQENL